MPSTASGRIVKSQRGVKRTPHEKNHRWESFSTKISKLHSLDPLRKVRRHDLEAEDLEASTSYLRNGLDRWAELNLSKTYVAFRLKVTRLTDSLAQILHHEDKIMDLLAEAISAHQKDALEPLLDLVTAFAHDLGVRFEKHYPRALNLIVDLASKVHDVEAIEWTFASLAFLFKYLSRLVVPDLRPTYDAVSPLMGKAKIPGHIARFAAEAMSFLVKKAAAPGHKERALPLLVEHVRKDLESVAGTKQYDLYSQGIMTLFAEALKAPNHGAHSTAPEIFAAIVRNVPEEEFDLPEQTVWTDICSGVLTSIIHHTTIETFKTIETRIVQEAMAGTRPVLFVQLLGVVAGVRRGNRIHDWPALVKALGQQLAQLCVSQERIEAISSRQVWNRIITRIAIVWGQAPIDALLPALSTLNNTMTKEPLMRWYIPFCSYLADLNPERFRGLFLKDFQKFIVAHWSRNSNEEMLCVLLPHMIENGGLPRVSGKDGFLLPQSWQDQIVNKFVRLEDTPFPESGGFGKDAETWRDKCLPKYSALLRVLDVTSVHPSTNARIAEVLLKKLKLALRPSSSLPTDEANFIMSDGFRAYLRMCAAPGSVDKSLAPLLRAATPRFCHSPAFLQALLAYLNEIKDKGRSSSETSSGSDSVQEEEDPLVKSLITNLSAPSHELRLASLQILGILESTPDSNAALATMIQAEQLSLILQNVRTIAVHLRKLGQVYAYIDQASWLTRAIPAFLFGMLTVPLSPVWDDSVEAMKKVAESKPGEEALADLALDWLDVPSSRWSGAFKPQDQRRLPLTDFECLNLKGLYRTAEPVAQAMEEPYKGMLKTFEEGQKIVDPRSERARSMALKALNAIPGLAEKRSRKLVPYLFSFMEDDETPVDDQEEAKDEAEEMSDASWSLPDRKGLVGVFSQFNNPRVLYQAEKVYSALLKLLANGDIEVQKLALKAILAWKNDAVKPYQEHLEYLLDEARFKNELTVLFQGDNKIQPNHRETVMPVLLHLLYGRTISKKGAASGRHGLHATRLAVIRHLNVDDMGSFLDIALGPLRKIRVVDAKGLNERLFSQEMLPIRKQVGLLNMVETVITELGNAVSPYVEPLANAILLCLISACRQVGVTTEYEESEETEHVKDAALYKVIRTISLKSLCKLFQNEQSFDWTPYKDTMVKEIISPRIEKLAVETTQGVSATWKLLGTWAALPKTAMFLAIDERIVPKIVETFGIEKTRAEVKIFALDILKSLVGLAQAPAQESEFNELIRAELLDPNVDFILGKISRLLRDQHDISRDLLGSAVDTVVALSPIVKTSTSIQDMVEISTFLLNQPSRKVSPKIKGSILLILKEFVVLEDFQGNAELKTKVYHTVSSLFGYFKDRQNRQTLAEVLAVFASTESWAQEVADICRDLNAYKPRRLDEADYNIRLTAFNSITRDRETPFTLDQWMPLLHNMLFYIQQDEEFGVLSTNSADGLCKFILAAKDAWASPQQEAFITVVSDILLPAIYAGSKEESETVRREVLRVYGALVAGLPEWDMVSDLTPLVPSSEDSDQAFFFHVLSPAVARQLQALRLLESVNAKTPLRSKHISQFFIPLFEHFIFGHPEGGDDHGLGAQAVTTVSSLTLSLEWQQYRAILRRFVSFVESKPDSQKRVIRLLDKEVDALRTALDQNSSDAMEVDGEVQRCRLATTLPDQEKLSAEIIGSFLPALLKYIHEKDETEVSSRVPVGVIIAKLLVLLPDNLLNEKLPGVLTDICHILRSKSVESRDMARDTLAKISGVLGAHRLGFILKELRGALVRGNQLHILSYTMHSLLLVAIPAFEQGDLDYCLPQIMAVIMDDIFGATGQEKDAEGYTGKMKEVKGSKSQDSMELVAKTASIRRLSDLTMPLQSLLLEKLDVRTVRKIDELLTRVTKGLLENPAAASQDVLIFCYEVIQEVYKTNQPMEQPKMDPRLKRYIVQKAARKSDGGVTAKHTYKLVRFAIDVLRTVFKKHDHLRTAANITGFLPILGDAVLSPEEDVKIAAFKMLTVIVKVPFKNDDSANLYKVALKEAIKAISMSPTTTSDLAQAALKLISVILRDRREIVIKDAALDMLLGKLKDDLTEPLYRHVTFNFLRSVLDRRLETAVVYDTLDYVGTVMITNADKDTRDLARGAFFQFLRDYPQKRNRWEKQLKFIVANLKYEREGGRISVMEVINLLLKKSVDEFAQEVAATCFVPLIFVLANDDSEKCRFSAGELLKESFRVADKERLFKFMQLMRAWIEQDGKPAVTKLALHAWGLYFEGREPNVNDKKDLALVTDRITQVLGDDDALEADWELANTTLNTLQTLVIKHPQRALSPNTSELWTEVQTCLAHSNTTVKLTATRLLSIYLMDFAKTSGRDAKLPLKGSYGLQLDEEDVTALVRLSLGILNVVELDEALAPEIVQVLMFLGGYLQSGKTQEEDSGAEAEDEDEEEEQVDKSVSRKADMKYVFWKLCSIIRKERQPKPEAMVSKLAAMDLVEAFCIKSPKETVEISVRAILRPLRNLTDPSIRAPFSLNELFKTRYEALKSKAVSVMEVLQRKLGSAEYTKALLEVGEQIRERRQARLSKRRIEAVAAPERYGREKRKKFEKKKERRKMKGQEQRDARRAFQGN
ncbi:putative U3 small nucleolar RNA-associated protein 20 [Triangularia setosa]|uniref:U3 small nucleolar RNA-associated protein 20 n=1 Tax=Triangularia setosa TaxID=2587417 RepID=A0AAN6WG05_9PEZI|nr:putative U3 small nucleolar RNA-associated protein 20 [Podospora setosa]